MEVYIDGVRYVPAKTVVTNARQIKLALLALFWGDCSKCSEEELNQKCEGLHVRVHDDYTDDLTIDEFIESIADIDSSEVSI